MEVGQLHLQNIQFSNNLHLTNQDHNKITTLLKVNLHFKFLIKC